VLRTRTEKPKNLRTEEQFVFSFLGSYVFSFSRGAREKVTAVVNASVARPVVRLCKGEGENVELSSRTRLERRTKEGDSPVRERSQSFPDWFLSTTRHVKARRNLGRLRSKAKYFL